MEIKLIQEYLDKTDEQMKEWLVERSLDSANPEAVLQIRITATGGIDLAHLQGFGMRGEHGNRAYGWAEKFYVESNLVSWLTERVATDLSFASEQRCCIRGVSLVVYTDGVALLIDNEDAGNVASGYLLSMNKESSRVRRLIAWATENDLITPVDLKMPRVPKEE